ncbi:MAG: SHOCT domain-containing protein [Gemmatimonadales bacterium]
MTSMQQGWGPGGHMGWAGGRFMWLFWLAALELIFVAIWALLQRGGGSGHESRLEGRSAEEILKERLARGEIDEDTFRRLRDELRK